MNNNKIIHVTDPLENQDLSTNAYVDDLHTKPVLLDGSQWTKGPYRRITVDEGAL